MDDPLVRAVCALPGCVGLSVWRLGADGRPSTVHAVDRAHDDLDLAPTDAAVLDAVQFADCGPGTDLVLAGPGTPAVDGSDNATFFRHWPLLASVAGSMGVHGAVAVPVEAAGRPGWLGRPTAGPPQPRLAGLVVLYLTRTVLVDLSLVRLLAAAGRLTLGTHLDDAPGLPGTAPSRQSLLVGSLLERRLHLPHGGGPPAVREAARRAGVRDTELLTLLHEAIDAPPAPGS